MTRPSTNAALDALPCGFVQLDGEDRVVHWNLAMERWTRRSAESVAGQKLTDLFPDSPGIPKVLARLRTSRQPQVLSQVFHRHLIPIAFPPGHLSGFTHMQQECHLALLTEPAGHLAITITDVTSVVVGQLRSKKTNAELSSARDKAEAALKELAQQQFALDQSAIVAVTNPRGAITYVNDRFCDIAKYSREELLGKDHRLVNSGLHPREFFQKMWATISSGQVWRGEIRNRAKDGTIYWVSTTIVPFTDPAGKPTKYVAIRADITEQKLAEEALRRHEKELLAAKESAEAATRAKSDFLATMSHEIRTPMNGVLGFTNLLLDTPLTAEQREFTQTIQRSGEGLLAIINDILDFSKIEAGRMDIELIHFDLSALCRDVVTLLKPRADEKRISLDLTVAAGLTAELLGDPARVRQVLINLVGNAIKFTASGGVSLRVEPAGGRAITLAVRDTGPGIPLQMQRLLFQKFSQADSSTTRRFGGTGLGLAICKRLVELMGGEIGLWSEPGHGSTFWFTLPNRELVSCRGASGIDRSNVTPPLLRQPHQDSLEGTAARPAHRVLVAEDTVINQRLAVHLLKKFGCEVDLVTNGAEAVTRARENLYDLILMDCHMPEMDGFTAARAIREQEPDGQRIPIIALTASVLPEDRQRCTEAGMDDFVSKPFNPAELKRVLREWSGSGQLQNISTTNEPGQNNPEPERMP